MGRWFLVGSLADGYNLVEFFWALFGLAAGVRQGLGLGEGR